MNVKVSIPVEIGGYTGQRDAWESHVYDMVVEIEDDHRIKLTSSNKRTIWIDMSDLQRAVEFIEGPKTALPNPPYIPTEHWKLPPGDVLIRD